MPPRLPALLVICTFCRQTKIHSVEINHASKLNYSVSIDSDPNSTQHLDTLQLGNKFKPAAVVRGAEIKNLVAHDCSPIG